MYLARNCSRKASAWTRSRIRGHFLDHFDGNGFKILPSASLALKLGNKTDDDPFFTPFVQCGSQPLAELFLNNNNNNNNNNNGKMLRKSCNVQKCADFNDDEYDLRFTEMLGAFDESSNKREMCEILLRYLQSLNLDRNKMYFTHLAANDEAKEIWLELQIPKENIIGFGEKENYWKMPIIEG